MDFEVETDSSGVSNYTPMGTGEAWRIIDYGKPSQSFVSSGFSRERTEVTSMATPFEFSDLPTKVVFHAGSLGTSSDVAIEIPETPLFINDRIRKVIVFPERISLPTAPNQVYRFPDPPQTDFTARLSKAFRKIGGMARLAENWDSYGAKPIDADCLSWAVFILKDLINLKPTADFEVPVPFLAPLSSGGIQIEWERGEKYLEVSISTNPQSIDYFAVDKAKEGQLTLEGPLRSKSALRDLLYWFMQGTAEDLCCLSFDETDKDLAL